IAGTSQDFFAPTPELPRRTEDGAVVGSMIVSSSEQDRRDFSEDFQRLNARSRNGAANGSTELLIENDFMDNDEHEVVPQPSRFTTTFKSTFAPLFRVFNRGQRTQNDDQPADVGSQVAPPDVETGNDEEGPPRERRRRHPAAPTKKPINPPTNVGLNLMEHTEDSDEVEDEGAQTYAPTSSKTAKRPRPKKSTVGQIGCGLATSTHSVPANMVVNTFKTKEGYKPSAAVSEIAESDPPSPPLSPQDLLAGPMDNDSDEHIGVGSLDASSPGYTGVVALNFPRQ
uniref:Rad21_Rec8 domain-containing protein n=1 Tax=Steinernema glaseri TaxID=37863 RepID=A0A1I7Z3T3_9BILA